MSNKPKCKLTGQDGNIFNLMAVVKKALVDAGITEINGFEYTIKDTKKLEDEANQKAINDYSENQRINKNHLCFSSFP